MPMMEQVAASFLDKVKSLIERKYLDLQTKVDALYEKIQSLPTPEAGPEGPIGPVGEKGEKGDAGPQGERGERGDPGERGEPGLSGERGPQGIVGEKGLPGDPGRDGAAGANGRDGRDGADGRDAMEIEPITNIEAHRSYARGTYASYKGSLIRAMRNTDPLKDNPPHECGWAMIIEGNSLEDMKVEHDGKRGVTFTWTKGFYEHSATIKIPCVIDAGFWKEGMSVEKGDGVTHGGSYWIAQTDTDTKPDLGNSHWRLSVKKGRDAR